MTYCLVCGFVGGFIEVKKHVLAKRYDYLLFQCKGDKELLKQFVGVN